MPKTTKSSKSLSRKGGARLSNFARQQYAVKVIFVGMFILAGASLLFLTRAAQHQKGAAAIYWTMPGVSNNLANLEQTVVIRQKAPKTYWALQFPLSNTRDVGYTGFQTDGKRPDGSSGEMAIFSLWNANASRNASGKCMKFDGEGSGLSCRMPFNFFVNTKYRFRVRRVAIDRHGNWWGLFIHSGATGKEHHVGDLRVRSAHIGTPLNFSEYFGPPVACDKVPRALVDWHRPRGNVNYANNVAQYNAAYGSTSNGGCIQSAAAVNPTGVRMTAGSR